MSRTNSITHQELLKILSYNPETGVFTRRIKLGCHEAGTIAGSYDIEGYRRIKIKNRSYKEHILAWFYTHTEWPNKQIDHKNGIKDDNRIENLRLATHKENHQNRKANKNSTSKYLGVSLDSASGKFKVSITVNKVRTHIGYFTLELDAANAYMLAKQQYHPFNPTPLPPTLF